MRHYAVDDADDDDNDNDNDEQLKLLNYIFFRTSIYQSINKIFI